jgi:hypothetical protein
MTVVRRLTEGDGLQLLEDPVLQRLTVAARRDVVVFLADQGDGSRPDRGAGTMAFNIALDYPDGTVGARLKAILTGIGAGQPWADVDALVAELNGRLGEEVLDPAIVALLELIDQPGVGLLARLDDLETAYGGTVAAATSATAAAGAASDAAAALAAALNASNAADVSAGDALQSATDSQSAKLLAETAAGAASTSAETAATSATSASGSASTATSQAGLAASAASTASGAADAAASSASSASSSSTAAGTAATAATDAKLLAETAAGAASTSASSAANSATSASGSASTASTKASDAAQAATAAGDQATAASTSASNASASATNASTSATAANQSRVAAETAASNASVSAGNAATAKNDADSAASSAGTFAGAAASSANVASGHADAASTAATNASTFATQASTFASAASGSATTASTKAAEATSLRNEAASAATAAGISQGTATAQAQVAVTAAGLGTEAAIAASGSASSAQASANAASGSASAAASHYENTVASTGALSAAVTSLSQAVAGPNGVSAQQVLKVSATRGDGKKVYGAIGVAATAPNDATGGQSEIILQSDRLLFVPPGDPNATPVQFLEIGLVNGVLTLRVTAAVIGDAVITPAKMSVSNLAAINADLGAITAGNITLNTSGFIRSGQTAFDTGEGFYIGGGAAPSISMRTPDGSYFRFSQAGGLEYSGKLRNESPYSVSIPAGALVTSAADSVSGRVYGSRQAVVSGGRSPFKYHWMLNSYINSSARFMWISSGAGDTATITGYAPNGLMTGELICFVTDADGRIATASVAVEVTIT